ncbi:HDIG domain-containing protein [Dactylosporangium aurantiacum]|uniref:HDIG domain-containing protein n=1 Tax=Dactylosporangium aurantiacum TaxID=35754 RepID=A0A9Q9MA65_9ACTN|nr:HD domain-containing protein [Dactylosporangium aurantiacum]MDG6104967.1 HDIG domain-containing protein [Dactylosporangium aurantiacum]UWZ51503.1 HDIG domain-containing protein [Dactylosporangium aurantiacum]
MTTMVRPRVDVATARDLAEALLTGLPQRWAHTAGVAARAAELCAAMDPADRDQVVAAAWLHDIGYAEPVLDTGFHPLDGARFLRRTGWTARISALVAHHSGACYVAELRGLHHELAEFPREHSPVADALTYADQTVGPTGARVDVHARMAEMLARHGATSDNARVHHLRAPDILATAERVERRLRRYSQAA